MPLRYAILHHTAHPDQPDHFDLMFELEAQQTLATFRSRTWPPDTAVERLPDHRRNYLTYEGPVSGNRGEVKRIAAGTFTILSRACTHWHLLLDDQTHLILRFASKG